MKLQLYKHQQDILDLAPKKYLLAWGTGSGKTVAALQLSGNTRTLVIVPKSLKEQWQEQTDHRVITKEQFKKYAKELKKYDCIIIDEAHYVAGHKSALHKAVLAYLKRFNPDKVYLLTATPYMSTPWNIYALANILGRDWKYHKFKYTFFNDVMMYGRKVPIVKKNIEGQIARLVSGLGNTVKMEDCFDVPEQTFLTEYFDMTREQKKAIAGLEDTAHIARWTKTHQICGGSLKSDGYTKDEYFKCEKLDRLLDLVKEHKKIIIICRYNNEIEYIKSKIKKEVFVINGATRDRHALIKSVEQREQAVVIINAACSEGYELPSFPIMVFYSYDFSLKNYIQMIGRILRSNKLKKNVYISLVVRDSIDNDVYQCIEKKQDFQVEIYKK